MQHLWVRNTGMLCWTGDKIPKENHQRRENGPQNEANLYNNAYVVNWRFFQRWD